MNPSVIPLIEVAARRVSRCLIALLQGVITFYRYAISPMLGPSCRYFPSCSAYAHEALAKHGAYLGTGLALRRLCRCHPWRAGGFDPVP